jgi:hypothetical protein
VLLEQQLEEVDELGLGAADRPLQALLLLSRGEVGAEEEELQLAVPRQGVGELAELIADRVELAAVLGRSEERRGVYAGDLLH